MATTTDSVVKNPVAETVENFGFRDYVDAKGTRVILRTRTLSYLCCVCSLQFKNKLLCLKHVTDTHQIEVKEMKLKQAIPAKCLYCTKKFSMRRNLYRHIRVRHPEKQIPTRMRPKCKVEACPLCNEKFSSIRVVNRHIRMFHTADLEEENATSTCSVPCHFCNMKFSQESKCLKHMANYHHANFLSNVEEDGKFKSFYECSLCDQKVEDQTDLKKHLSDAHEVDLREFCIDYVSETDQCPGNTFNCDECHLSYKSEGTWRSHVKDEHQAFPESCCYKCGDYSSKTINELKCHLKNVHSILDEDKNTKKGKRQTSAHETNLGLTTGELRAIGKIPDWLLKHGEGRLLLVVQK